MLENRRWIVLSLFFSIGLIFSARLFFLQVIEKGYKVAADDNSIKRIVIYPDRGLIYDRKGKVLVLNAPIYDLMVTVKNAKLSPEKKKQFCELLGIAPEDYDKLLAKAAINAGSSPVPFLKQLSKQDYARIQDRLIEFPAFFIATRTVRAYPHQSMAHLLGYIAEISETDLLADSSKYYSGGDYVGKAGLEAFYEKELRGLKGVRNIWVDSKGKEKGAYRNGAFDTTSIAGQNLYTSIDFDLQQYAEKLMQNKAGSAIAIEPKTGQILAMVSSPYYDPNLLIGKDFSKNYATLTLDEQKPLFNRCVTAHYPPGSTFKTVQLLIGKQMHVINDQSVFYCNHALVKCHGHPTGDLHRSIQYSCNPYYWNVYRRIIYQNRIEQINDSTTVVAKDGEIADGYKKWFEMLPHFNIGRKTMVDVAAEKIGRVPKISLYNNRYGEGKWNFSNIYSLGIGQGEIELTPIQLANVACIIANRGYYYPPHVAVGVGKDKDRKLDKFYTTRQNVPIDKEHYEVLINGMRDAYRGGTVGPQAIIQELDICGKTGTAQNPRGQDHSVFICFAPRENPEIAVAVYVENAGFGGDVAAPVAILMIEKYLKGKISKTWLEKMIMEKQLIVTKIPQVVSPHQFQNDTIKQAK
jgi:penicillin-binding protein 2